MAANSKIEWTDATWNPIAGCSLVSPGCTNCYAMRMAARIERIERDKHSHYAGTTKVVNGKPVWTGKVALARDDVLLKPLRWRKPRTIFVNSMSDLFHESVPGAWIDLVFAVMALCPQHTFPVLTKRPARMREYMRGLTAQEWWKARLRLEPDVEPRDARGLFPTWPLPNVRLGVSAEDQQRAEERIPALLETPAAVRFVSAEPLLGPMTLTYIRGTACLASPGACCGDQPYVDALRGIQACRRAGAYSFPHRNELPRGIDWVIVGGESGPGARPMHPDWARAIRDECAAAGVPFFFKQHGNWLHETQGSFYPPASWFDAEGKPSGPNWHFWTDGDRSADASVNVGKKRAGRLLDGVTHDAMPERAR